MEDLPFVSVIVTTKNEEHNIANCLLSVKKQSYPPNKIEMIVVDNNSSDNTVKIAKQFTHQVYNEGPERSAQRNFGVKKASGRYILYLDVDMILSSQVIEECVRKCENEDRVALYIPEKIVGRGFWIKARNFERSFYNVTVIDCVRFIRRDKFLSVEGFDSSLTGPEDWDFDRKIRAIGKVSIVDIPLYHNEGEFKLKHYLNKKNYYSKTLDRYIQKWGKNDLIVRKQVGVKYRLFEVFIENGKWKKLMLHPLLVFGIYFLRFMLGIQYLKKNRR